ncbi:MAG: XRE family transcriptional regulator [Patescibacteria group bacterium]
MTEEERSKLRRFYEDLGTICSEFGFTPYIPHIYGDPAKFKDLSPEQIDRMDRLAVTQSYLVVAYVGVASTGVGIEIEMAYHANKPTVLLYEKTKLHNHLISRLVRGNPTVTHQIVFDDELDAFEDAKSQLRNFLHEFCSSNATENLPEPISLIPQMVPVQ